MGSFSASVAQGKLLTLKLGSTVVPEWMPRSSYTSWYALMPVMCQCVMTVEVLKLIRVRTCDGSLGVDTVGFLEQVQPFKVIGRCLIPGIVVAIQDLPRLSL
jgi:hypothetical protein